MCLSLFVPSFFYNPECEIKDEKSSEFRSANVVVVKFVQSTEKKAFDRSEVGVL